MPHAHLNPWIRIRFMTKKDFTPTRNLSCWTRLTELVPERPTLSLCLNASCSACSWTPHYRINIRVCFDSSALQKKFSVNLFHSCLKALLHLHHSVLIKFIVIIIINFLLLGNKKRNMSQSILADKEWDSESILLRKN